MHRLLPLLSTLLLLLAACGKPGDPAEVTFDPALNIDLGAMTHTESGLYFQEVVVGTADPAAAKGNIVSVHYTGWLASGRMIDTSRDDGRPFAFTLGQGRVIPGWEEGLLGMRVGGQRRLVLPSWLAYGEEGVGDIPPNSVLVFDVELMAIR